MADLGKNGYQWTGYTEPFITSIQVASAANLSTQNYDGLGAGIVAIANTEWRNSNLYIRSDETDTGVTTFTSKDLTFDTRMDGGFLKVGKFVITDGVANVTVDSIVYSVSTGLYTVTVSAAIDVVDGKCYRAIGRLVDVGTTITASKTYEIGDRIQELYAPEA